MPTRKPLSLLAELADFLATRPDRDAIVGWKPSRSAAGRLRQLLLKQDEGKLAASEATELDDALQAERMVQGLKARLLEPVAKRA